VSLRLLDTVPVSLLVLVVIGMAFRQSTAGQSQALERWSGSGTDFLDLAMASTKFPEAGRSRWGDEPGEK
jgi:hypothetical protein